MEDIAVQLPKILKKVNTFLQSDFVKRPPYTEPRLFFSRVWDHYMGAQGIIGLYLIYQK